MTPMLLTVDLTRHVEPLAYAATRRRKSVALSRSIASARRQLADAAFVANAPESIVAGLQRRLAREECEAKLCDWDAVRAERHAIHRYASELADLDRQIVAEGCIADSEAFCYQPYEPVERVEHSLLVGGD